MNREIKFRAWDIDRKTMIYDAIVLESNLMKRRASLDNSKNVVWLQYTGLKDKNGKEIYEGDIVRTQNGNIREIVFKDTAFHVIGKDDSGKEVTHPFYFQCILRKDGIVDLEIIGNIYENPDLLK